MGNNFNKINLLPIPWMKQKLESIYEKSINGNLFLIYNEFGSSEYINYRNIIDLLDRYNIIIDHTHPIYFYFPIEVDNLIRNLILAIKSILPNHSYIILAGYKEYYPNFNEVNCIANIYSVYPELKDNVEFSYLIDSSKSFEIFTSLSDTQRINIKPESSCTISGPAFNYNINHPSSNSITHISFVKLIGESSSEFVDYYIKGLTNKNNNFNFNF